MKAGPLLKVSIRIALAADEPVMELLARVFGSAASVFHDLESGTVTASVYLPKSSDWTPVRQRELQSGLDELRQLGLDLGPGTISRKRIRREDWAESWKRHFKPMEIGHALLLKPSWSQRKPRRGQALVVLDPGLSFGTGQHPTTRFCLEQLAAASPSPCDAGAGGGLGSGEIPAPMALLSPALSARRGRSGNSSRQVQGTHLEAPRATPRSFLDIGTGSGILAIAAAKLGYRPVEAFDFDPDSVRVARENARRNDVSRRLRLSQADLTKLPSRSPKTFDLVCANLIYDLLLAERSRILSRVAPGGTLVLAGILTTQFELVHRAYAAKGWSLIASREEKEWKSGAFQKPTAS